MAYWYAELLFFFFVFLNLFGNLQNSLLDVSDMQPQMSEEQEEKKRTEYLAAKSETTAETEEVSHNNHRSESVFSSVRWSSFSLRLR